MGYLDFCYECLLLFQHTESPCSADLMQEMAKVKFVPPILIDVADTCLTENEEIKDKWKYKSFPKTKLLSANNPLWHSQGLKWMSNVKVS